MRKLGYERWHAGLVRQSSPEINTSSTVAYLAVTKCKERVKGFFRGAVCPEI